MRPLLSASLLLLVACSASSPPSGFPEEKDPSQSGFVGGSDGDLGGDGTTPANEQGCSEEAKLVYVLSAQDDLYQFNPRELAFRRIGRLDCPAAGASPNSMAIDRSGTAWVNYDDGSLFKVSTKDAGCEATTFERGQAGIVKFGMAFASDGSATTNETLFVSGVEDSRYGNGGKGLAKIDLETMQLTRISDYSGGLAQMGAELTGTGDGRLYGFFTTYPDATLAKIEKGSASTSDDLELTGVYAGNAWAFSFWGGDFWFYTSTGQEPSEVTRLSTSESTLETVLTDVGGFQIVGAGVSTCAPLSGAPR